MRINAKYAKNLASIGRGRTYDALDYICAQIKLYAEFGSYSYEHQDYFDSETMANLVNMGYDLEHVDDSTIKISWGPCGGQQNSSYENLY